jgi:hypothetical protein
MQIVASPRTAAVGGAWSALGFVPFDAWLESHRAISTLSHNLAFFAVMAVFLVLPVYLLVIGRGAEPFSRTWFLDKTERARYAIVAKRMSIWFVSAGVTGAVWSALYGLVVPNRGGL